MLVLTLPGNAEGLEGSGHPAPGSVATHLSSPPPWWPAPTREERVILFHPAHKGPLLKAKGLPSPCRGSSCRSPVSVLRSLVRYPSPVAPDEGSVITPLPLVATVCPSSPQDTARSITRRAWQRWEIGEAQMDAGRRDVRESREGA